VVLKLLIDLGNLNMKKIFLIFSLILFSFTINQMHGQTIRNVQVVAIPGIDGLGSGSDYLKSCFANNNINIIRVGTPSKHSEMDFGQDNCIKYLRDVLASDNIHNVIIHATSCGGIR